MTLCSQNPFSLKLIHVIDGFLEQRRFVIPAWQCRPLLLGQGLGLSQGETSVPSQSRQEFCDFSEDPLLKGGVTAKLLQRREGISLRKEEMFTGMGLDLG